MAITTWHCPVCKRRVPGNIPVCRCGTPRAIADAMPHPPGILPASKLKHGPLPWEVKAWAAVVVLTMVLAVVRLLHHDEPQHIVPVLGYVDRPPLPPSPSPKPSPPAAVKR